MDSHIKVEHEKKKDHICHLCGTGFARAQGKDLLRYGRNTSSNFILLQLLRRWTLKRTPWTMILYDLKVEKILEDSQDLIPSP